MKYSLSLAKCNNIQEILNLYHDLIGMPGCTWSMEYPDHEIIESDIETNSLYALFDDRQELVGVASIQHDPDIDALCWNIKNACDLARVGILQRKQNQGLGHMLMKELISIIRKKNFDGIRILVGKDNIIAQKLYQKHNFTLLDMINMYGHDFYRYELVFTGQR